MSTTAGTGTATRSRPNGYLTAAAGLAAVLVGAFLLLVPGVTVVVTVALLAGYLVISGAVKVFSAVRHRDIGWMWDIAGAVLSIAVGVIVLANALWSSIVALELLFVALAFAALVAGAFQLYRAFRDRSWGHALLGVAEIAIGVLLFLHPVFGLQAMVSLFGIAAIVAGLGWLIAAFQRA